MPPRKAQQPNSIHVQKENIWSTESVDALIFFFFNGTIYKDSTTTRKNSTHITIREFVNSFNPNLQYYAIEKHSS